MDILFLLVPLSVMLVLAILGGLWWAIERGQFDDVDMEGERILHGDWSASTRGAGCPRKLPATQSRAR